MSATLLLAPALFMLLVPSLLSRRDQRGREVRGSLLGLWWVNRLYCGFFHQLKLHNEADLPEQGPAMLIANHTSGVDNFLLQAGCRRVLGFLVAQEWYDHKVCGIFCRLLHCIPVKRDGRDLSATRDAIRMLSQGRVVPLFPEGKILPKSGLEIGPGRSGAAFLALRSQAPVYPAYIWGTPATNNVMKAFLGCSQANVIFGPPVDLSKYYNEHGTAENRAALNEVTNKMMTAIHQLKDSVTAGQ